MINFYNNRFSSETLFQKIVTSEAYSEREISSIICEILKTIAGLHRLNIVYKDLQVIHNLDEFISFFLLYTIAK